MKRFIKEYAGYTMQEIKSDNMYNAIIKDIAIMRIKKILTCHECGLITIHECMNEINHAINYAISVYNK